MKTFLQAIETYTNNKPIILNQIIDNGPLSIVCPSCGTDDIHIDNGTMTCVGGYPDPNHYWKSFRCLNCFLFCGLEHKYEYNNNTNVWFVENGKVLFGVNSCFEQYTYKCKCGGTLKKLHIDKNTKLPTSVLMYSFRGQKKSFYDIITCDNCGLNEEIET